MKILVILFMMVSIASADPFLTCDPQAGVTKYKLVINEVESFSDAKADGSAWHDMVDTPVGEHNATFVAGKAWTIDGVPQEPIEWSDPTPFVLGRPGALPLPTSISLKDNH